MYHGDFYPEMYHRRLPQHPYMQVYPGVDDYGYSPPCMQVPDETMDNVPLPVYMQEHYDYLPNSLQETSQCPWPTQMFPQTGDDLMNQKILPSAMDQRKRKGGLVDLNDSSGEDDSETQETYSQSDVGRSRKYQRQNHSEIEKRRRDKMNLYIMELSSMIPMCAAMNRKLDKLTILRMAVQHMKSLRGSSTVYSEVSQKPSFISDSELKQLILKVAEGFLFVIGCDRGRLLYVSESVKDNLNYSQSELIGQSLFDILHPKDIAKVKEQLSSSDLTPRERFIDAKTMMPVKTEVPQKTTQLSSGAKRCFFFRMKCGNKPANMCSKAAASNADSFQYNRKKKSEKKNYVIVHCTGYLKSWSSSKMGIIEDNDSEECPSLNCLVAIGRIQPVYQQPAPPSRNINIRPMEYTSRLSIDGKFANVDERVTSILGYLPQELIGSSVYEYYHPEDIERMTEIHHKVLESKQKIETSVYRFQAKDGRYIYQKSICFTFYNPWTKYLEYIVSTNIIVHIREDISSDTDLVSDYSYPMELSDKPGKDQLSCIPRLSLLRQGVGRIGKQIAEEALERSLMKEESVTPGPGMVTESSHCAASPAASSSVAPSPSFQAERLPGNVTSSNPNSLGPTNVVSTNIPISPDVLPTGRVPTTLNGLSIHTQSAPATSQDARLFENVIQEQAEDSRQNPGSNINDEAALAFLMSLLEADAGLGGPIDFNNLPWPL